MSPSAPLPPAILSTAGPVVALVGAYGSGKTEVAIQLALGLAHAGHTVQLADLDLVNPYFRSREAREELRSAGVRVVVPPGDQVWADLPIVLPEITGLLHPPPDTISVLDVGGDDVGARALAAFRPRIGDHRIELWQVLNSRRPFSANVAEVAAMRQAIESASRLPITGLVANSHLLDETRVPVILEGWELANEVSSQLDLPVVALAALESLADDPALRWLPVPRLRLTRRMLPPWRSPATPCPSPAAIAPRDLTSEPPHPARRAVPIGRPVPPLRGSKHG